MNLAASNIAWPQHDRDRAYVLLRSQGFNGLEIAPGLLFPASSDVFTPTELEVTTALAPIRSSGLELVSMQSLLFGVQGARLFGDATEQAIFKSGIIRATELAGRLGIPNLVLGSPTQRQIPAQMPLAQAHAIAQDVVGALGDVALREGARLGIEANPAVYGTNFLNTISDAANFVVNLGHPAVSLILDIGAMHINGDFDSIEDIVQRYGSYISHVHISEPNLSPAPASVNQAARVIAAMQATNYRGWFSIEMRCPDDDPLGAIKQSLHRLADAAAQTQRGLCA